MTLRNMDIINYLAKQEEKFSSEMLRMDFEPYLNKNFVRQVLARHRKKFDLEDERECESLFEIACQANDPETVKYLIRQGRGKSRYALLGEAQMSVFQQCASIPQDALTQDAWMEATGSGEDAVQEDTTQGTDNADQTTDGADSSADTSEDNGGDTAYNTDTSLVVADGDAVNIDYTGYVDDVAFDGGSTNGAGTSLTIGSARYIDDFEEQLIGHHVGETVTVNVTFPEDYSSQELQGKEARFEVTINGIYE